MKLALVVGHNNRAQGAVRVTDGISGYSWNSDLARIMYKKAPDQVEIFIRVAEKVAKTLELKERQAEAEVRARSLVAKWLQILLGALFLIGTLWSSRWLSAIDQIKAFLGAFR